LSIVPTAEIRSIGIVASPYMPPVLIVIVFIVMLRKTRGLCSGSLLFLPPAVHATSISRPLAGIQSIVLPCLRGRRSSQSMLARVAAHAFQSAV
jgi:hypothetical protein